MSTPKEISRKTVATGKFIKYQEIIWEDADGVRRPWEVVERIIGADAVLIIPWLQPSNRLILVRQYRPPAGGYVLEFPAGLIDPGESPEIAAKRELIEEAGFKGEVVSIIPPSYNTPGLSGETVYNVYMNVPDGQIPLPEPDDGEHIELQIVARSDIETFVQDEISEGNAFDSKLLSYLMGIISAEKMVNGNWLQELPK